MNAVPQAAVYGLTLQEQTGITVQSIIFNDEAAWVFDPALVLASIDEFMTDQYELFGKTWIPPWIEFSYYLNPILWY